jgi:hypothetical protein
MPAKRKRKVAAKVANRRGRQIIAYIDESMKDDFAALALANDRTLTAELVRALRYWLAVRGEPPER